MDEYRIDQKTRTVYVLIYIFASRDQMRALARAHAEWPGTKEE